MKVEEIFELVSLQPKMDQEILDKTTPEYWEFWLRTFGRPKKSTNEEEYWLRCGFTFVGWIGAIKAMEELEQDND